MEKYPSGKNHLKYTVKDGQKDGWLTEFFENGTVQRHAQYKDDQRNGKYLENYESGKKFIEATYRNDKLVGKYTEYDRLGRRSLTATYDDGLLDKMRVEFHGGKPVRQTLFKHGLPVSIDGTTLYPMSFDELRHGLAAIDPKGYTRPVKVHPTATDSPDGSGRVRIPIGPFPAGARPKTAPAAEAAPEETLEEERLSALRRLNCYRLLCGLAHDVTIDPDQAAQCEAGAKLLVAVGQLTHTPKNPGLPDEEYQKGYDGTSHSNIYQASGSEPRTFSDSVDAYVYDSNPGNIEHVGHRRWCLNPTMSTTAFGKAGMFSAMYSFDERRALRTNWQTVAFPPPGYMPVEYFHKGSAWSLTINRQLYVSPGNSYDVTITPLDDNLMPGKPLEIEDHHATNGPPHPPAALIFRPKTIDSSPGRRYWVDIRGVTTPDKQPVPIHYLVEFCSVKSATAGAVKSVKSEKSEMDKPEKDQPDKKTSPAGK